MYQRILVAIDNSHSTPRALDEALKLAGIHRAELHLVTVINLLEVAVDEPRSHDTSRLTSQADAQGEAILAPALAQPTFWRSAHPCLATWLPRGASSIKKEQRRWKRHFVTTRTIPCAACAPFTFALLPDILSAHLFGGISHRPSPKESEIP